MIGLKEQEKEGLIPVSSADAEARARQYQAEEKKRSGLKWLAAGLLTLVFLGSRLILLPALGDNVDLERSSGACAQPEALTPKSFDVSALVQGKDKQIISWLSDAVKVPTEIFDVMGPIGEDPRWDVFYKFADYLEKAFPLVHKHLVRTRVVTHALVFEWIGSDPSLKPLLLTGHQDVVPVLNATRGLWTHDPYGGEYDESTGLIWGRGSGDDKSGTIGALSAVELLLESGKFNPARTVILAFGIDEETGGKVGAYHLNEWIENKYGKDSIAMLVDEGSGTEDIYGQLYATPAVAEKGYLDVEIKVETLGGHSSVPPTHTGIGYLALLIAELEKNPHQPHISLDSPLVTLSSCMADYSPEAPSSLKRTIRRIEQSLNLKKGRVNHKAWKQLENWWLEGSWKDGVLAKGLGKAMITTTQAVDIISGGMKVNALPEVATAVVNHRINIASSPTELTRHLVDVLGPVARHHNLELVAFGRSIDLGGCSMKKAQPNAGKIVLSEAFNSWLETAPVSPHTVDSAAWRLLSGTVKSVYATRPEAKNETLAKKTIQMAPTYSTGNTDTKRYWGLTRNIYRFAYQVHPAGFVGFGNAHTVDEHIPAYTFIEEVRWFMNFIVNVDESREI